MRTRRAGAKGWRGALARNAGAECGRGARARARAGRRRGTLTRSAGAKRGYRPPTGKLAHGADAAKLCGLSGRRAGAEC
eukprot:4263014-Lingulodinium_polyedra.AAC.1